MSLTKLILTGLVVMSIAATSAFAQSKKDKEQAKKFDAAAEKALRDKDFAGAVKSYSQSIALVATNPVTHYNKGVAHYNLKEYDSALGEFATALNQGYKPAIDVYRSRVTVYVDQKNYEKAIAEIQSALAIQPNDLFLMKTLGEAHLAQRDYPAALDALKKASVVAPNDADIHYGLARAYFFTGDYKSQGVEAEAATNKGTRYPADAFYLLGDSRQRQKDIQGAIYAYKRALDVNPKMHDTYRQLSELYRSEGELKEAIEISKKGLENFVNDGYFYTDLSWYYSLSDRPQDAVNAAKAGITLLPSVSNAYTTLCRSYNEIQSFDLAVSTCNQALKLAPNDGETYFYLGRAFVAQNRKAEATAAFKKAVIGLTNYTNSNPTYSDGWYLLANALFSDGQREKAQQAYKKCIEISPRFAKARINLGITYTLAKDKRSAMEQYDELMKFDQGAAAKLKDFIDKM